ncbi:hypothetical protein [Salipaludibacillus sp. CF4.18]|uniref:hypothetical protein n=1 Tax=Salipaludibacillus sp. CF4.18 TaxID=3373081 RepID=UPI003EE7A1F6
MTNVHVIKLNGQEWFRKFNDGTGTYDDLVTKDELLEVLLEEFVTHEIEVDNKDLARVLKSIPSSADRELLRNYIEYLERLNTE